MVTKHNYSHTIGKNGKSIVIARPTNMLEGQTEVGQKPNQTVEINVLSEKEIIIKTTECIKECTLAETETVTGEIVKAEWAMGRAKLAISRADTLWQIAKAFAERAGTPKTAIPSEAKKTIIHAHKQIEITTQKNNAFRKQSNAPIMSTEDLKACKTGGY